MKVGAGHKTMTYIKMQSLCCLFCTVDPSNNVQAHFVYYKEVSEVNMRIKTVLTGFCKLVVSCYPASYNNNRVIR